MLSFCGIVLNMVEYRMGLSSHLHIDRLSFVPVTVVSNRELIKYKVELSIILLLVFGSIT